MSVIPLNGGSDLSKSKFQTNGTELGEKRPLTLKKPWGEETWLVSNKNFHWKTLKIRSGHRFSLQYHPQQIKVFRVISGRMEITHGTERDSMKVEECEPGSVFNVPRGTIHRVKAISPQDLVLDEVSTPEDDTRRLEDDYGRE